MIIDMHAHAFPDTVAARAIEKLESLGDWEAVADGTLSTLLKSMKAANVDCTAICAIATKPGQANGIIQWLSSLPSRKIISFASIHPADENPVALLEKIQSAGLTGIKLHPFYQDFHIDAPEMRPIFDAAAEMGIPVTLHCGMDIGFLDEPGQDRASLKRIAAVSSKFPKLKILCTHMGGWGVWETNIVDVALSSLLENPNVYFETSMTLSYCPKETFLTLMHTVGAQRVCFGTDWPWNDPLAEIATLYRLLSQEDLAWVLSKSAQAFLGQ